MTLNSENFYYRTGTSEKNRENHMKGELMKIQEFILVIIFVILGPNQNFGLKMQVLKFLGIRPTVRLVYSF